MSVFNCIILGIGGIGIILVGLFIYKSIVDYKDEVRKNKKR